VAALHSNKNRNETKPTIMKAQIEIIIADITMLKVDAIVNAANSSLTGGGGVDGAIHKAAGAQLTKYCRNLGCCETGASKISPAFNLPSKFVIHTVGPVWNNGTKNEEQLLYNCYVSSLQLAIDNHIKTIAFPSISTGTYRFPFDKAANIALETIGSFLETNESIEKVYLVTYNERQYNQYNRVYNNFVNNKM
jgi:O-acetyl-ADP-ribose deacetylase